MVGNSPTIVNGVEKIGLVSLRLSKKFNSRIRSLIGVDKKYVDKYSMGIIGAKDIGDGIIMVSFVDIKSRDELYDILVGYTA